MKNSRWIVALGVMAVLFTSCHTAKKVTNSGAIPAESVNSICPKVIENAPRFETMNVSKMGVVLNINGQTFNTNSSLRMAPDSIILLSIQPLSGFEMARVEFTPKKVVIVNKLAKRYFEAGYDYFRSFTQIPLSYELIEDVIMRRLFVIGRDMENCVYSDVFLLEKEGERNALTSASADGKVMHNFTITPEYLVEGLELMVYLEGSSVSAEYGKTATANGVRYPETMMVKFNSRQADVEGDFTINKIAFNKEIDLTPTDLTRFERVTLEQVLSK